jgi:hypothetical protein
MTNLCGRKAVRELFDRVGQTLHESSLILIRTVALNNKLDLI